MSARRVVPVLVVVGLLLVGMTSCGTGGSKKVDSATWAKDVCTRTKTWVKDITDATPKTSEIGSDLTKGRTALVAFFDRSVKVTDTYLGKIDKAGVPDVKDGGAVAKDFKGALSKMKTALQTSKTKAEALSTTDSQAFARDAKKLSDSLTAAGNSVKTSLDDVRTKHPDAAAKFKTAFNAPECKSLAG